MLPENARKRFYLIFFLIVVFSLIAYFFAVCIVCTNRSEFFRPTQLDLIIDTQTARQEAARRTGDPLQDGAPGHPVTAEVREAQVFGEDF